MRCISTSTAESYDIKALAENLDDVEYINYYYDALHASYADSCEIFVFKYGCVVMWNVSPAFEAEFMARLKNYSSKLITPITEEFEYSIGSRHRFFQDKVTLTQTRSHVLQKLAVSYGISQSIKLAVFENDIERTIAETKYIPIELATKGKISLTRKAISKKIGSLVMERNSVNLHSDILDAPIFIWDHPEYEKLYNMTVTDLELHARTNVINKRLDIVKDLFEMMREELNNRHSSLIEMTIVMLITIEVILTLIIHVFHWV